MNKITFAIAGMGSRGNAYASKLILVPDKAEIRAAADPRRERLIDANSYLKLPEDRLFPDIASMLEAPRLSDVMIIATQDAFHKDHAIAAMEKGYDLILEKPIAAKIEDAAEILRVSEKLGRRVLVCHVLRYTPFYRAIKNVIDAGTIGRIETIEAMEGIGYYHLMHSYVRGNWHRMETSSPIVVAKCCHDMDIFYWLTGEKCKKLSSFGSLDFYRKENAPEGSAERCTDCRIEGCPFNAVDYYTSHVTGDFAGIVTLNPTPERLREVLKTSDYGRCVFKMDNDVADHQVVSMLLENGTTVGFQLNGFAAKDERSIRILGTKGEIRGRFRDNAFMLWPFGKDPETVDVLKAMEKIGYNNVGGHGGGDFGLIHDALLYFMDAEFDRTSVTELKDSIESHYIAFAAEESRAKEGALIDMASYRARF
ncbi:MAG: Gfo/Idh/MocA family oxidoreductase [Lachnospiraceae bacterium]|nr:Gfo/Idh/MocA family oxidoreductase [Lachnospiraceae bacterium]